MNGHYGKSATPTRYIRQVQYIRVQYIFSSVQFGTKRQVRVGTVFCIPSSSETRFRLLLAAASITRWPTCAHVSGHNIYNICIYITLISHTVTRTSQRIGPLNLTQKQYTIANKRASVEPVKATLSTSGCDEMAAPAVCPKPVTTLSTPAGRPASFASAARYSAARNAKGTEQIYRITDVSKCYVMLIGWNQFFATEAEYNVRRAINATDRAGRLECSLVRLHQMLVELYLLYYKL